MARSPPALCLSLHPDLGILAQCCRKLVRHLDQAAPQAWLFRSIQELKHAIHSFIADTNAKPKPFIWTKDPDKIIAAARRGHQMLDSIH
jgi:hypothetical protein